MGAISTSVFRLIRTKPAALLLCAVLCLPVRCVQGQAATSVGPQQQGEVVDRVVAVVNQAPILDSDLDEERRFANFRTTVEPNETFSRKRALERLIDRALILQQAKLQALQPIPDADVNAQIALLRKQIPACRGEFHCETDAGWKRYLDTQGFSPEELKQRWRERMEVLQFIDLRFRGGIRIPQTEVKAYYDKTMLPEYSRLKVTPPELKAVSKQIREVLLQQQVSSLMDDWLKSLKAQGSVRVMSSEDASALEGSPS